MRYDLARRQPRQLRLQRTSRNAHQLEIARRNIRRRDANHRRRRVPARPACSTPSCRAGCPRSAYLRWTKRTMSRATNVLDPPRALASSGLSVCSATATRCPAFISLAPDSLQLHAPERRTSESAGPHVRRAMSARYQASPKPRARHRKTARKNPPSGRRAGSRRPWPSDAKYCTIIGVGLNHPPPYVRCVSEAHSQLGQCLPLRQRRVRGG